MSTGEEEGRGGKRERGGEEGIGRGGGEGERKREGGGEEGEREGGEEVGRGLPLAFSSLSMLYFILSYVSLYTADHQWIKELTTW